LISVRFSSGLVTQTWNRRCDIWSHRGASTYGI